MKILFVTHGADMMGANRCLLDLLDGLSTHEIEPVILLPGTGPLIDALEKRNLKTIIHPYYNWAFTRYLSKSYWLHPLRAFQNKQQLPALSQKIKTQNFDLIYTNSSQTGIGAFIADAIQVPHVWHIREFGEKDYNLAYWKGRSYFNAWANKAAALISMSQGIADETLQGVKVPVHVIHDGIITKEKLAAIPIKQSSSKEPFTFLIIGLIHPTKGQLQALTAFNEVAKRHDHVRLLIAGKGRRLYTQKLQNFIQKNGLSEKVKLLGYINNPYEVHQESDALLMCSKSEGMGRVTLEAMIFCNPVVGFNAGGTAELVNHKSDGFLYRKVPEEIVAYMNDLVENPDKALAMGQQGRLKIEQKYTMDKYIEKVIQIFKSSCK